MSQAYVDHYKNMFKQYKSSIPASEFTKASRLRSLLIADSNRGALRNQESGRVDRGRLANLVAGDQRVFMRKHRRQDTNTFVQVCVDASGSMEMDETIKSLIVLDSVFRGTNIQHEILAWSGSMGRYRVTQLRDPSDTPAQEWTIAGYHMAHGGGTPTAGALPVCAKRLIDKQGCRRVMIFVSDGMPNYDVEVAECRKLVTDVLPKYQIEVFGLSIGDKTGLDKIIPVCGHADNFNQFSDVLLSTAKRALL